MIRTARPLFRSIPEQEEEGEIEGRGLHRRLGIECRCGRGYVSEQAVLLGRICPIIGRLGRWHCIQQTHWDRFIYREWLPTVHLIDFVNDMTCAFWRTYEMNLSWSVEGSRSQVLWCDARTRCQVLKADNPSLIDQKHAEKSSYSRAMFTSIRVESLCCFPAFREVSKQPHVSAIVLQSSLKVGRKVGAAIDDHPKLGRF